jgi:hypothetical protein
MWILKNSKDLSDNLKSRSFSQVSSIKTFDFSTLYTTLPHDTLYGVLWSLGIQYKRCMLFSSMDNKLEVMV